MSGFERYQQTRQMKRSYWQNIENQRTLFDKIAKTLNVNKPEDWKNIHVDQVLALGASNVLVHYGHSLSKGKCHFFEITWEALGTLYPETFVYKPREAAPKGYWKVSANRIQFIEKLAAKYSILDTL
jgi:hypothetical protein